MGQCLSSSCTNLKLPKVKCIFKPDCPNRCQVQPSQGPLASKILLPFVCTDISEFWKCIESIGKDNFTVDEMKEALTIGRWQLPELWKEHGELQNLVNNFTPLKSQQGKISKIGLMAIGLLWCSGDLKEKAEIFTAIIDKDFS